MIGKELKNKKCIQFCLFFNWLMLSCMNCLCMLDLSPLLVTAFANIFTYSVGCFFILSIVCFAMEKLLSLISSNLFIFTSISFALGEGSKKNCYNLCWKVFCLFSYNYVIVSCLTFRSVIHFEFIFVYGVSEYSNFIILYVAVQFYQHHLLKQLLFLHCTFLPPLS